jgi:SNF2 family DNA or RNA helicase
MLDLVESVFLRNGIQNLRYDGSMNREAREYVLSKFKQPGGPRVILIRYVLRAEVLPGYF